MRLVLREACDALELGGLLSFEGVKVVLAAVQLALEARELTLTLVKGIIAAVEGLLALHDATLHGLQLALTLLLLGLGVLPELQNLLLGLEHGLLLSRVSLATRLRRDAFRLAARAFDLFVGRLELRVALPSKEEVRQPSSNR